MEIVRSSISCTGCTYHDTRSNIMLICRTTGTVRGRFKKRPPECVAAKTRSIITLLVAKTNLNV